MAFTLCMRLALIKLWLISFDLFLINYLKLYAKFKKGLYHIEDIDFITYLITEHSHWDSVDFISKHILGIYLLEHPEENELISNNFSNTSNLWLNRASILFQLGYKEKTDADLLFNLCDKFKTSKEFFIQKAIGWALREYGKYEPNKVLAFVERTELKPLSQREAIRRIK